MAVVSMPVRVKKVRNLTTPKLFRPAMELAQVTTRPQMKGKALPPEQQQRKPYPAHHHREETPPDGILYKWQAQEHAYQPRSAMWFIALAAGVTLAAGLLVWFGNILGAIVVAFIGGVIYMLAQRKPETVKYQLRVDGVAVGSHLYAYEDLDAFNVVYKPGEVKTVLVRSKRKLAPLINMEIGEADPVEIRDVLLEFLPEDLEMAEPLTDVWARRFGF